MSVFVGPTPPLPTAPPEDGGAIALFRWRVGQERRWRRAFVAESARNRVWTWSYAPTGYDQYISLHFTSSPRTCCLCIAWRSTHDYDLLRERLTRGGFVFHVSGWQNAVSIECDDVEELCHTTADVLGWVVFAFDVPVVPTSSISV
jgi:hypothetical protein